jgi:hypothetical protein
MLIFAHIRDNFANAFFPRLSEWAAAGCLLGMGWMLSINSDLMASTKTQAYQLMLMIAEQSTWATFMLIFAAARLVILLINGAWRRSPHLRSISAFLTCFFWTQIVLSFLPTFGFAFVFSAAFLCLDFVNSIRAARDARIVDAAYSRGAQSGGQD